jgi:predicted nucleotidyltransferase
MSLTSIPAVDARIALPLDDIAALCRKYEVVELSIFGSALRDDFTAGSDVDILVTYNPDADLGPWMSRFFDLRDELAELLGRPVDLIERAAVEQSRNPFRRPNILNAARVVYAA